ncbi:MAG: GGDEF domain-containing protein [Pseudomonadota bacterium]|nr:GGDEF domain-containing protein [Pseudomonadota bacterium]
MPLHTPTLLVAFAVVLVLASVASVSVGLKQQSRRGARWWVAANALFATALALQAGTDSSSIGAPIAAVLALQWPIVMLGGIRRFYSRGGTRISEWADRIALAIAVVATVGVWTVGVWIEPRVPVTYAQVHAMAALFLTLYVAAAVARLEDFASSSTLRTLRLGMVAGAIVQLAWLAIDLAYLNPLIATADAALGAMLTTAVIALLMTQLSLVMNHERRIAHLLASQRKLRHLVDVDTLTRLPNRRHFHELAERAVEAARDAATLIVFDVDRMQRVNELLGHPTGDEALRQIGTALRETLRRRDVAGRLGGDEFAVVLPRTRLADSTIVVSRIISRLDDRQVAPRITRVSLNVGSVQMIANETIGEALRRAEAMLVSKRDEARRGDTMPMPREAAPVPPLATDDAEDDFAPTPSALMSLIPVGDVSITPVR